MFQFPPFASLHKAEIIVLQTIGLSHSEIAGSTVICTYPALIAAYHVLHRLREPRHPPSALVHFHTYKHARRKKFLRKAHSWIFTVLLVTICQRTSPSKGTVENIGVEPMTSCMPCKRSSQLS